MAELDRYLPNLNISQHLLHVVFTALFATFSGFARETPPQPFFDPDGLALPLFYCYHPPEHADGSHLELLPARHVLLAPAVEGAGALVALDQISCGGESEI